MNRNSRIASINLSHGQRPSNGPKHQGNHVTARPASGRHNRAVIRCMHVVHNAASGMDVKYGCGNESAGLAMEIGLSQRNVP